METLGSSSKFSGFKLTAVNTLIAMLAGLISITGGVYSLKNTVFSGQGVGSLSGIVRDEAIAKPLLDATVEISNANNLVVGTYRTDQTGRYEVNKLREGPYIIKVSAVKHQPQVRTINVERNQTSTVHFDLTPVPEEAKSVSPSPTYAPTRVSSEPLPKPPFFENQPRTVPRDTFIQPTPSYVPTRETLPPPPVYPQPQANRPNMTQALMQTGIQLLGQWAEKKKEEKSSQTSEKTYENSHSSPPPY